MFDNYGYANKTEPATPPAPQKVLRFDRTYVRTVPGILKLVQLASNLLGFIAIKIQWGAWISPIFYNILYWMGIVVTAFLLLMYTFHVVEKQDQWPWLKMEFFYCCIVVASYIILSIIATTIGESVGFVVGFFGLCATIAYGFDGFLKYKAWKRGLPPQ